MSCLVLFIALSSHPARPPLSISSFAQLPFLSVVRHLRHVNVHVYTRIDPMANLGAVCQCREPRVRTTLKGKAVGFEKVHLHGFHLPLSRNASVFSVAGSAPSNLRSESNVAIV